MSGIGPLFSVLMPTHYRPDVIGLAIGSVLAQTEPDFELLVVGDGAAPGTADIVQGFGDPRIRWFDFPKGAGLGYANRNRALAAARGALVAFAADDDLMLPDHLERHAEALRDPAAQWSYSLALWVSRDGIAAPDLTNLDFTDERETFIGHHNTLAAGTLVYRAAALGSSAAWPENVGRAGDWLLMRRLLASHGPAVMRRLPVPTLLHFTAGTSGKRSNFPALRRWLQIAERAEWWPSLLRATAGEITPQAAYARLLRETPQASLQLRAAATDVTHRIALERLDGHGRLLTTPGRVAASLRRAVLGVLGRKP